MNSSPSLERLEVGYRHFKAKAAEGGWYEVLWNSTGWEWRFHWPASYRIDGGALFGRGGRQAACENYREAEGTMLE